MEHFVFVHVWCRVRSVGSICRQATSSLAVIYGFSKSGQSLIFGYVSQNIVSLDCQLWSPSDGVKGTWECVAKVSILSYPVILCATRHIPTPWDVEGSSLWESPAQRSKFEEDLIIVIIFNCLCYVFPEYFEVTVSDSFNHFPITSASPVPNAAKTSWTHG